MGEISAHITLENSGDRDHFRRGYGQESHIRRSTIDAIVDTGAVTLVLPQNVVGRLAAWSNAVPRSSRTPTNVGRNGHWRIR